MDKIRYPKYKLITLSLALAMLSACSSSKVGESAAPAETVSEVNVGDANTDAVPTSDQTTDLASQPAPDALDAAATIPSAPPTADVVADAAPITPVTPLAEPVASAPVEEPVKAAPVVAKMNPSTTTSSEGESVPYRVKQGDTLMKIAFENYGDLYRWKEIYESNRAHIQDPNHIPPGTQLSLNGVGMVTIERNGEQYKIKHGDTLGTISNEVYGTVQKWKKLWENNRQLIKNPNKIYAGFYLFYQPETRLTHDESEPSAPVSKEAEAPAEASSAQAAAPTTERVPASNKGPLAPPADLK